MKDDNGSSRKILSLILTLSFALTSSFSQKISLVQYPDEVVKGEKFSVKLNLYSNPSDTLYIIASIEGDANLIESFAFDDTILNIEPTKLKTLPESQILKNFLAKKTFIFADTFRHSSILRSYAFTMSSKSSGTVKVKFLPFKIYSDSLIFDPSSLEKGQISINVKGSAEKTGGLCVKFEKDGFIKFNIGNRLTIKNGFTLSFWLKTTAMRARVITLSSGFDKSFASVGIKSGNVVFSISNSIGKYEIKMPVFVSDGKWHNIIICAGQNDETLKFFIDGEKVDEIYIPNLNQFEINAPVVKIEHGLIDEVAFLNTYKPELIDRLSRYFVKFDSNVVFLLKFENETINVLGNVSGVESNGVRFVPSSAPVCSPGVRVSAELKENNISINWEVDDPAFVDRFIVERKVGEELYQPVYQTAPSEQRRYSFLDVISEKNVVYYYRVKRINKDGGVEFSDEVKVGVGLKRDFEIMGNFPNPFNSQTKIIYDLFNDTYVKLAIYDIVGREIAVLVDGFQSAGRHEVVFDLSNVKSHEMTSGIYFYKLQTQRSYEVRKMIVIK